MLSSRTNVRFRRRDVDQPVRSGGRVRRARAWPARRAAALGLVLALVVGVMLTAFAWPAVSTAPRDVPVAVVGPVPAVEQVAAALSQASRAPSRWSRRPTSPPPFGDRGRRRRRGPGARTRRGRRPHRPGRRPERRDPARGRRRRCGRTAARRPGRPGDRSATTEVVVPGGTGHLRRGVPDDGAAARDECAAVRHRDVARRARRRCAARDLLVAAPLAGGIGALVAGSWLDIVPATWGVAGVVALGVLAVSGAVTGAHAVLGRLGVAVVAPVILLFGNPLSAAATARRCCPTGGRRSVRRSRRGHSSRRCGPSRSSTARRPASRSWCSGCGRLRRGARGRGSARRAASAAVRHDCAAGGPRTGRRVAPQRFLPPPTQARMAASSCEVSSIRAPRHSPTT